MEEDPTILQFPLTFDDTTAYEDRQILKSLKIIEYLREKLPTHNITIDHCSTSQLRIYCNAPDEYYRSYRIRLGDKPGNKQSVLTGEGRKFCTGIDAFVALKSADLLKNN